ncbi:hypothetical protein BGZ61DRAFT_59919 [Ilyonectria robusta]|uniref:uncharacterized protein n=1 Tax=Ilyonectria robusta TaxID=1079257 RepID=UPI001E8D8955|nr:uncharacterized protein BGZ61DRAFT_59919 [Ilyonectria robusta]KAH8684092.1 hypothetical protein BGZ61DRAFT_59919 [Ilyonectria robusta]
MIALFACNDVLVLGLALFTLVLSGKFDGSISGFVSRVDKNSFGQPPGQSFSRRDARSLEASQVNRAPEYRYTILLTCWRLPQQSWVCPVRCMRRQVQQIRRG